VRAIGFGAVHDAHVVQRHLAWIEEKSTALSDWTVTATSLPARQQIFAANVSVCGTGSFRVRAGYDAHGAHWEHRLATARPTP